MNVMVPVPLALALFGVTIWESKVTITRRAVTKYLPVSPISPRSPGLIPQTDEVSLLSLRLMKNHFERDKNRQRTPHFATM